MSLIPIKLSENLQLQKLGVSQANIGFYTLSIESDKYICVCDKNSSPPQVVIIDVANPAKNTKYPIKADSARMSPTSNLIALKAGLNIQVYDGSQGKKMKATVLPEEAVFWKWVTHSVIAFVSQTAVYHWSTDDSSESVIKIFERSSDLANAQVISYKTDLSLQWFALVCLSAQANIVTGKIQLFSSQRSASQIIDGQACTFINYKMDCNKASSLLFSFSNRSPSASKLFIIELGQPSAGNQQYPKKSLDMSYPADTASDFPLSMHSHESSGILFIITKVGLTYLYEIESGSCIFLNRISNDPIFVSVDLLQGDGFMCVNRVGFVLSVSINKEQIVPYLISKKFESIAYNLAARTGYPGAEGAFLSKFNEFFSKNMFEEASLIAARSTGTSIRNAQTIARFKALPPQPGATSSPLYSYFSKIIEHGKLNTLESVELCRDLFIHGKKNLVEKWLSDDKLECSEELGDMAKDSSPTIALSVYIRAKCHEKVVLCFAETGQFDSILKYAKRAGYQPNYVRVLRLILYKNPDGGLEFAKSLLNNPDIEALDINALSNCFIETNLSSQFTAFLLEALKNNLPEQGDLQTKFLEQNILSNPQIVEQILARNIFTHFDKPHIASLCEKAGLIQWALQFYSDIYDIKRVIVQTHLINSDWLVSYFGSLSVHDSLSCLKVLMDVNRRQNLQIVVQVAVKYHEQLGAPALIQLFETSKCFEGLFMFLSTIVNSSQDPEVHFKYIQAACKTNQLKEVERICKESNYYDPEKVKNLLKEYKLSDQIPLIIVCDRFNFVEDLVLHLHKHNLLKYIEIYVHKVNPSRLPEIVGALLDVDCQEDFIKNMMIGCPPEYSTVKLIEEVSRRNRIKLLRKLVESRINSGSIEPAVHSALAIVNIDSNTRPEVFLKENPYYDSLIVGKYCEDRNPTLSCLAYEKGGNDDELIRVCTANSLYKNLSRYVILKKSQELWAKVLNPANDYRRSLIEQASQSILTESYEAECISEMVKALVAANLPDKLIDLLEKIVLVDSPHRHVRNLQNLLLLTSIRSDPSRLLDYIQRLDNYDAPNIADMAINHKLYEEAFAIYKKFEVHSSAIAVLTNLIKSLDRAFEYAERYNIPEAWSILGRSQLTNNQPKEAIESFLKANDFSQYNEVIAASSLFPIHESMIKYLSLCRTTVRDSSVDSGYAYCLAFTGRYEQLQDFLNQPHNVNVNDTGIRLFDEEKYEGAKILFKYSNNFSKLAVTHVKLKEYQFAVEMARKANKTKMWRVVCIACLDAGEYRFAHICALSLVIHPEELENLVRSYEELGLVQELLLLIEASVNLERAHMGVFTELAILYAKYKPTKLKDHLDLYWTRINIPKVLKNCEKYNLWSELVFLYDKYEEYDNAIRTMIRHPATAFNEPQFRDIIQKVANHELYQESINFYYEYKPFMLNDLLIVLTPRIDHSKIINQLKSLNIIPACKGYLIYAQKSNMAVINEAINDVYVEEEAYDDLRLSVESFNNFDAVKFADKLEQQPSVEFRRIAIFIRKSSNRWSQTLEMAKKDGLYDDAIIYAAESKDTDMAQSLLDHFIEINRPDYVVSHLYFSYDILKPDQVLESCWLNNMSQYCMPYMIQYMKECTSRLDAVETRLKKDPDTVEEQSVIYPIGHTLMIGGSNTFSAPTGGINPQNFVGQPQPLHPSMNSFTRPRFNPFS